MSRYKKTPAERELEQLSRELVALGKLADSNTVSIRIDRVRKRISEIESTAKQGEAA